MTDPTLLAGATGAHGISADLQDPFCSTSPIALQLRPYQERAVAHIGASSHRRILVVSPTGSGKAVIATALIRDVVRSGARVLFVDHRREITRQICEKLFAAGLDFGVIQAGFPTRPGVPVQVASVQSLHARAIQRSAIQLPPADLVVIDECHHCRAQTWQRIIESYSRARIVGLTATPARGDGRGLGNVFESLIEVATVAELTALGFLVPARVYAPTRPDLTGVHVRRGDYVEGELAERMNTAKLVGDIVEHWFKLGECRRTVIFCVDVAHSLHIRNEFCLAGVMAEHIDGHTPIKERDRILAKLATGEIEIVTNCGVLTEGWDCPAVACIVLARPTKSLVLYRQMVGRVLRPAPNKTDAIILDHAGAVFVHGFVDDAIEWALNEDDRAVNKTQAARQEAHHGGLTTCPECHGIRMEGQPCLVCGWWPVVKPRHVEFQDGDLGQVDRDRTVRGLPHDEQKFYCQLMGLAKARSRKPGWAAHKFKEKFGRFPPWSWNDLEPLPPGPDVVAWARSRDIAYAKAMQAQR